MVRVTVISLGDHRAQRAHDTQVRAATAGHPSAGDPCDMTPALAASVVSALIQQPHPDPVMHRHLGMAALDVLAGYFQGGAA